MKKKAKIYGSIINEVKDVFIDNQSLTVWDVYERLHGLYSIRDLNNRLRLLVKTKFLVKGDMQKAGPYKQLCFTYSLNKL